jgi:multidrug efflux system outer membrane protein
VQRFQAEVLKNQGRRFTSSSSGSSSRIASTSWSDASRNPSGATPQTFMSANPAVVATGLPSELLENRPDVKAAELQLEASKFDTRSAKARFYPSLRLDAGVGFQSFNPTHLIDTPQSLVANLAGNLMAPLLNRAAIKADYRSANARQIQAVFDYERTILQAFTDVYNQLTAISNLRQRYEQLSSKSRPSRRPSRCRRPSINRRRRTTNEVLMTTRDSLEAEMELVDARKDQMQAVVSIYQALGGGWRQSS